MTFEADIKKTLGRQLYEESGVEQILFENVILVEKKREVQTLGE